MHEALTIAGHAPVKPRSRSWLEFDDDWPAAISRRAPLADTKSPAPEASWSTLAMPVVDTLHPLQWIAPVGVAGVLVALGSLLREPARQRFSAVFLAGAGAAYLSGGFGALEFVFCAVITVLAYLGLQSYRAIAAGWLLHSVWDVAHHLWGHPIIPFAASSSLGCAICDPVLAAWYALGAPSIWRLPRRAAG